MFFILLIILFAGFLLLSIYTNKIYIFLITIGSLICMVDLTIMINESLSPGCFNQLSTCKLYLDWQSLFNDIGFIFITIPFIFGLFLITIGILSFKKRVKFKPRNIRRTLITFGIAIDIITLLGYLITSFILAFGAAMNPTGCSNAHHCNVIVLSDLTSPLFWLPFFTGLLLLFIGLKCKKQ